MAWLSAHVTLILTVWGVLWALATALQNVFPAGSTAWKVCHAVLAVSPLDFMKAIKTLGAAFVPPVLGLLLLIGVSTSACAPAAKVPTVDARALARASVSLLEDAWMASAEACVDLAVSENSDPVRATCEKYLTPARNVLIDAADGVDLWTEADQRNFPCLITSVAGDIGQVSSLQGIKLPQLVTDGLNLAQNYAGKCAP